RRAQLGPEVAEEAAHQRSAVLQRTERGPTDALRELEDRARRAGERPARRRPKLPCALADVSEELAERAEEALTTDLAEQPAGERVEASLDLVAKQAHYVAAEEREQARSVVLELRDGPLLDVVDDLLALADERATGRVPGRAGRVPNLADDPAADRER